MKVDARVLLAARQSGRSWSEIAERYKMSVADVKAAVEPLRVERRVAASTLPASEERLAGKCICGHALLEHGKHGTHLGQPCRVCGPERILHYWYDPKTFERMESEVNMPPLGIRTTVYHDTIGCDEWLEPPQREPYTPRTPKRTFMAKIAKRLSKAEERQERERLFRRRRAENRRALKNAHGYRMDKGNGHLGCTDRGDPGPCDCLCHRD